MRLTINLIRILHAPPNKGSKDTARVKIIHGIKTRERFINNAGNGKRVVGEDVTVSPPPGGYLICLDNIRTFDGNKKAGSRNKLPFSVILSFRALLT